MKKNKKIIILISSLSAITVFGQANKSLMQNAVNNTAVQSPNAAALFRYSETPVSLYTGIPDISLPIYTIKEGDIEVPISISYHAGGIKVNDEASSVGLGWNLNAGGRVSHIMAGGNDFGFYGYYNIYPKTANGYVGSISGCPTTSWNTSTQINTFYTNNFGSNSSTMTYTGSDFQPDLFLINLPNKTHKAYLDMPKTTRTDYPKFAIAEQSNIDFKLIPTGNSGTYTPDEHGNYTFKVTDESGLIYSFEGAKEVTTPLTGTSITGVSRYLTKIENLSGKQIKFYYTPLSHADRLAGCKNTRLGINYSPQSNTFANYSKGLTECNKETIDESFIERIEFPNGRVEFTWSDREDIINSKKLSSIKVYNNYKLVKQYDLNYDYFIATDNLNTNSITTWLGSSSKIFTHRLRLLNINEALTNEKHSFEYNSAYNLPNKLSFSTDFWGYFNGQNNSDTFIPDPTKYLKDQSVFNVTSFNQDQSGYWYQETGAPQWALTDLSTLYINYSSSGKHYLSDRRASSYSLAGILTSITYPTGGKTEFEYESNTFSNYPLQSLLDNTNNGLERDYSFGGGLRIKNIKTIESSGSLPIIKSYIYDEPNENGTKVISNGILSVLPKFYEIENRCYSRLEHADQYNPSNYILANPSCGLPSGGDTRFFRISVYEGMPSQGISTLPQGGHIGYSKVIEQIIGKEKTESYFVNNYNKSCLSMIPRGSALNIGNGDLIKQMSYNNNNNLIKEVLYTYKLNYPDNLNTYFISGGVIEPVNNLLHQSGITEPYGGLIHNYTISLYKSLLESTTTKEYFPAGSNNYVETKTLTTYNNKYQPSIQKTTYPDTSFTETNYNYALEKGNQLLISKNMVGIPLETIVTQTLGTATKTLAKTETVYPKTVAEITNNSAGLVLPLSVKSYDISNLNNTPSTEVTYDKYDLKGNLQQYTAKNGISTTIIWGYNNTQPIAKIEGAKLSDISQSAIDAIVNASDIDASAVSNNDETSFLDALKTFKNSLPNYQITTYTYDPLIGVTSITPPSGIRELYKYDTANRLEKVIDINGKVLKEFKYNYKN